jgi:hypothetical protein
VKKAWQRWPLGAAASSATAHTDGQKLTATQETTLVEFALVLAASGAPLSKGALRMLASTAFNVVLSKHWAGRFLKRHKKVLGEYSPKRTAQRRKALTLLGTVKAWVAFINELSDYQAAGPTRVFNVDECRLSTQDGQVLKLIFARNAELKQLVSDKTYISACMVPFSNAAGETTHVFFVIGKRFGKGQSAVIEASLFEEPKDGPAIYYIFNSTGNVCKDTFNCMLRIFSEAWALLNPGLRSYLWMDNLSAHDVPSAFEAALKCNVWVLFLPAGTTHIFQPLDQFPFAILKNYLRTKKQEDAIRLLLNGLKTKTNNDITVQHAIRALASALSPGSLKASFAKCGLVPWNGAKIVQLARDNVGKLKAPTVNETAHAVAQTIVKLMSPKPAPPKVVVEAQADVAYTSVQLIAMADARRTKIEAAFDAAVAAKRVKAAGALKRSREVEVEELQDDGLPQPNHEWWERHCVYCATTRRSNSVVAHACETCGMVYVCGGCGSSKKAKALVVEHMEVCKD